ncbi:leucine-rich repeat-containing protein 74A-like isoform X1 [Haliotis rufescens]|uniref:leucine-rich repeat-containing protein 74A-like isoform X1 n=1 Tax=Haliotis rufescens TaxID=6454 RepID=UPI00201EA1EF|nr:leucine-rich repeat-containing protein 74A-like isoform X1 [Haliotis rufescens]
MTTAPPILLQPHVQRASSGRSSVHTRSSQRTCHEDIQTPGPTPCSSTPSQPAPTPSQHDRTPIGSRPVSLDSKKVPPSMPAAEVEDDLETELDTNEKPHSYDDTGTRTYERACRKLGIIPSSNCVKKLGRVTENLDLKYYGMGARGAMAVSMALVINDRIASVNMCGNDMGPTGMMYMQRMMQENNNIVELNISENNLGTEGARHIGELLRVNKVIRHLDASGNDFTDADAQLISKPVEAHTGLVRLNLSHNSLGDAAAGALQQMIAENSSLQELDLSWNHFRGAGAIQLAQGLSENVNIKVFNVSWNGFDDDGAVALASCLKNNSVVVDLDVACNRVGQIGVMELVSALKVNDALETLRIGKNNISEECAGAAVEVLRMTNPLKLTKLDMSDVILSSRFADLVSDLYDVHPELDVVYGYTDSYGKRKMKGYDIVEESMKVISEYLKAKDITIVELFSRFDADGSMSVTHEEFKEGLRDAGIPLSDLQVEEIIKQLDMDGDGEIDFSELVISTKDVL